MASAPPTIIADFVLGKTGNRIAVALARETVAAARLYGGSRSHHDRALYVAGRPLWRGARRKRRAAPREGCRQARPPSQETGEVRSLGDVQHHQGQPQTPAREGAEEP